MSESSGEIIERQANTIQALKNRLAFRQTVISRLRERNAELERELHLEQVERKSTGVVTWKLKPPVPAWGDPPAVGLRERDVLWCKALAAHLNTTQLAAVVAEFNKMRED